MALVLKRSYQGLCRDVMIQNYSKLLRQTVDVGDVVGEIADFITGHNNVLTEEDCMVLNFG